jgi:CubicO group peptidase (beta-lactamase class C family)
MPLSRRALFLTTAAVATSAYARKADAKPIEAARAAVREVLAANPVPAFSIAVMRGDELAWAEAFGKSDLELDVAATPAHRFRLGSVSKVFVATLAAQLAARGVVGLDEPISRYMPDLPEPHRATTLRQLLTHRGGVRHYQAKDESLEAPGPIDRRSYKDNAEILAVFINDPLIAKPGETIAYSTFGYTLISIVLESAAKLPFLDLIQREIAAPLALSSLGGDAPSSVVPNRVRGYHPGDKAKWANPPVAGPYANAPPANPVYKWAGGGLLATPTDVARFGAAHLAPAKIPKAALDELFTVQAGPTPQSPPLGLGWRIDEDSAKRPRWHHAGAQQGARASLVIYPKEKLTIGLASNLTSVPGDVNSLSAKIADAFATGS